MTAHATSRNDAAGHDAVAAPFTASGASRAAGAADGVLRPRLVRTRFREKPLRLADTQPVNPACPVCQRTPFEPVSALVTTRGERVLERAHCASCGHLAFSRMPSEAWFQALYRHEFENVGAAPPAPPKKESIAILDVLLPRMAPGPARILDVGCGYGSALQNFRALGHSELFGVEPSDRRAQVARAAGFHVAHRTAESMLDDPIIQGGVPFDVVYSWHAFEHVFDVRRALGNAVRALRAGGLLFICVPHQEAEHFVQMAHYLPHIHSFSNESLRALMEASGLEVVYEDGSLRMIGRKREDAAAGRSALPPTDHRERLRLKFIRDFGLRKLPELGDGDVCFQYSDYRGSREALEPSFGKFRRLDEKLPGKIAARVLSRLGGVEARAESLPYRLGTRWLGATTRQPGPFVIGRAQMGVPARGALPKLDFVYERDSVRAWHK
jgi:SAM-dependent methyltransferase